MLVGCRGDIMWRWILFWNDLTGSSVRSCTAALRFAIRIEANSLLTVPTYCFTLLYGGIRYRITMLVALLSLYCIVTNTIQYDRSNHH